MNAISYLVSTIARWLSRRYLAAGRVTPVRLARWANWHYCHTYVSPPRPAGNPVE